MYARASKDPQLQKISVDRQVRSGITYGQRKWPDAEPRVFRDDGITAADPDKPRPGFDAFCTAVRACGRGELVGVIANEQSRLTRQGTAAWDELIVMLGAAGLSEVDTKLDGVISIAEGNRTMGRIKAILDQEYVERCRAKSRDAHAELFTDGRPSGRAPFGYSTGRDTEGRPAFIVDDEQAAVVREVYAMALHGHSAAAIVAWLNTQPVPPRAARWQYRDGRPTPQWAATTVRTLLRSPTVAGLRAHTDKATKVTTTKRGRWDPIIDPDQWQQVQRLLGGPQTVTGVNGEQFRIRTAPRPQARSRLLSGGKRRSAVTGQPGEVYGVLLCGKCHQPLIAQTQGRPQSGRRVPAYACHPKIGPASCGGLSVSPAEVVDAAVIDAVKATLAASPKIRKLLQGVNSSEVERWRAERDAAKARTLRAAELLGAGTIDEDQFEVMQAPAKAALKVAQARLETLATDQVLPSVEDVLERWETLTLAQQRAVIERLIESIVIAPDPGTRRGDPHDRTRDRIGVPKWRA